MTRVEIEIVRRLYNEACHGAGAKIRNAARKSLESMCVEAGESLMEVFDKANLNMDNYFASRPID